MTSSFKDVAGMDSADVTASPKDAIVTTSAKDTVVTMEKSKSVDISLQIQPTECQRGILIAKMQVGVWNVQICMLMLLKK